MASHGGDIVEVTYNHPTLGSGTFFAKANEDSTFDPGGFRVDDDMDSVSGDGESIRKKTRKRWSVEMVMAQDMNNRQDVENKLVPLAEADEEAEWTIEHSNGTVYTGKGSPVGDLQWNANAATFTLKVSGGQRLTKIVG